MFGRFLLLALAFVVTCLPTEAIMNPGLMSNSRGTCLGFDVPDTTICYPTRCYHLFNITSSGTLTPTPIAAGSPQNYPKFSCTVATEAVYSGLSATSQPAAGCRYALCTCVTGGASCRPGKLADCWRHTCP
eukprot:GILI01039124.1.p1 GENE.GILI01039124.1~~GILI01039124.1.p1  ORF type:complete len:131 (-),score=6.53 GILI01039124.1:127-519(-)